MLISLQLQYQQILNFFFQQALFKGLNDPIEIINWIDKWIDQLSFVDQLILFDLIAQIKNEQDQHQCAFSKQKCLDQKNLFQAIDLTEATLIEIVDQIDNHLKALSINQVKQPSQVKHQSNQTSLRSSVFQLMIAAEQEDQAQAQASAKLKWPYIPRFQIQSYLGEGQTSKVYLAIDHAVHPPRLCALKVGVLVDPMKFEREIFLMKQISHPNLIPYLDAAQFEDQGIQKFWISMPNLMALNLEDLIFQDLLDLNTKISTLTKVLDGLCALHQKGIVHQNLTTENCLLSADGEMLLSNCGLSIYQASNTNAQFSQTLPFNLISTAYLSPEQLKGQKDSISFQSDVWAFGIMIYEILVGDLPWGRSINHFEILNNIQHLPIPMEKFNALGFPKMQMVIDQCLNREIKQRFPHAIALKNAFIKASQEDLQVMLKNRREKTCLILKEKRVFETCFETCLLEGKTLTFLEIVKMLREMDQKMDWDWEEISWRFTLGEQWVNGWYTWKDDYLRKVGEIHRRLAFVEQIKTDAMEKLMDSFKEKMNQVPSAELYLRLRELQDWQKKEADLIDQRFLKEKLEIEREILGDRQRIEKMLIEVYSVVWQEQKANEAHIDRPVENSSEIKAASVDDRLDHKVLNFLLLIGILFFWVAGYFSFRNDNQIEQGINPKHGKTGTVKKDVVEWITINGGTFMMGSWDGKSNEKPMHSVTLRNFYMSKTEVTVEQYRKCVNAGVCSEAHWDDGSCHVYNGSRWSPGILGLEFRGEKQPIVCVDWNQARAFAKWVGGDLPSEAQWEYASRSEGKDIKYPWGNAKATCDYAVMGNPNDWKDQSSWGCGNHRSWEVCSKIHGNSLQELCDLSGNVWEWVLDEYHSSYSGAVSDETGWCSDSLCEINTSAERVFRGGSWNYDASYLRAAVRNHYLPSFRHDSLGFRVSKIIP